MEASCGCKRLFTEDALDGSAVFVDLFGLAYDLVDGSGIRHYDPIQGHGNDRSPRS